MSEEKQELFPEDVKTASEKITSDWLSGADFEGEGLTLKFSKPMEKVVSNNPQYGAVEGDWLVEKGLLQEGETFRYHFADKEGTEKRFDSKSAPFFLAVKQCENLGVGDFVKITRSGKTNKTRYAVEKV